MTGAELRVLAEQLFGANAVPALTDYLRVSRVTVYRWFRSKSVPGTVEAAVLCWSQRAGINNNKTGPKHS